jgi:hypothetical protein
MNSDEFKDYWEAAFPQTPPIGSLLRSRYSNRWLRIHTLPNSKRYPESEQEYQEVLRRHNEVLDTILLTGQPFVLLATSYSHRKQPAKLQPIYMQHSFRYCLTIALQQMGQGSSTPYWHIWFTQLTWHSRTLDLLLRDVASNDVANILISNPQRDVVYHPYDGGGDIIAKDDSEQNAFKVKFAAYLSSHPEGL